MRDYADAACFVMGVLLLVACALVVLDWWLAAAAERWYCTGGIHVHGSKPLYVRYYDRREAERRGRRR